MCIPRSAAREIRDEGELTIARSPARCDEARIRYPARVSRPLRLARSRLFLLIGERKARRMCQADSDNVRHAQRKSVRGKFTGSQNFTPSRERRDGIARIKAACTATTAGTRPIVAHRCPPVIYFHVLKREQTPYRNLLCEKSSFNKLDDAQAYINE